MLDLNDIVVFARVVEAGSFTAAARLLGMPKTTVSRRIAALEREVGVPSASAHDTQPQHDGRGTSLLRAEQSGAADNRRCEFAARGSESGAVGHDPHFGSGRLWRLFPDQPGVRFSCSLSENLCLWGESGRSFMQRCKNTSANQLHSTRAVGGSAGVTLLCLHLAAASTIYLNKCSGERFAPRTPSPFPFSLCRNAGQADQVELAASRST